MTIGPIYRLVIEDIAAKHETDVYSTKVTPRKPTALREQY